MTQGHRFSTFEIPMLGTFLKIKRVRRHLKTIDWALNASPDEIRTYQISRLKTILAHAYRNVPLYRRKWDACGVRPEDFQTLEDLSKFPIVTKQDFRDEYPDGILAADFRKKWHHCLSTTGSTGSPVHVFYDRERGFAEIALLSRSSIEKLFGSGLNEGLSIFIKNRSSIESLTTMEFRQADRMIVDALGPVVMHIAEINRRKPHYLLTYPSVLLNIAQKVQEDDIHIFQPEFICTTGESMTPTSFRAIRAVFTGEFCDCYATTEVGCIAITCFNQTGFHIFSYKVVVEITDDDGKILPVGRPGAVVLTDLYNMATPIIRYSGVGDISRLSAKTCSCVMRNLPMLESIEGRAIDSVILGNRRVVHPYRLTLALQDIQSIRQFQIRQETLTDFRVLIVLESYKSPTATDEIEEKIRQSVLRQLTAILGKTARIRLEFVREIPAEFQTHKHSTVVSLIGRNRMEER
ncbi:MAG: hypothetical protein WC703_07370 [Candidatus Neomarinimicrobiota bacterium]